MKPQYFAVPVIFLLLVYISLKTEQGALENQGTWLVNASPQDGDAIVFGWAEGIEAPMARELRLAFEGYRDTKKTIILDLTSPGGALREGSKVIEQIEEMKRTHKVITRVRYVRQCLSMCVPIFLQGDERLAHSKAKFMFHEPRRFDLITEREASEPDFEREYNANRFFNRYFADSVMSEDFTEQLRKDWVGKDVWYTGKQLWDKNSGVLTTLQ